jgi:hypothetical protein
MLIQTADEMTDPQKSREGGESHGSSEEYPVEGRLR